MKILMRMNTIKMMNAIKKKLIVILGPTASGKTSLGIKIAKKLNTEILSSDSRQFYRELIIGTATPSQAELKSINHHFINHLSIKEKYNIGEYEKDSIMKIESLFKDHDNLLLVGGSGLYIDAICKGVDVLPNIPKQIREDINNRFLEKGLSWLQDETKEIDPDYYKYVDTKNPQRLKRCLEIFTATGKKISSLHNKKSKKRNFDIIKIGIKTEREILYTRINNRVDQMINDGLIEEAKKLLEYRNYNALNTVGYKELFDYFDGKESLKNTIENIKQNTRRLAKRQLTWFKRDEQIKWFSTKEYKDILKTILK